MTTIEDMLRLAQQAGEGALIAHIGRVSNSAGVDVMANARLIAAAPNMLAALKAAKQFIENGVELGFIRMPDRSTPDPAHNTLPAIKAAIAAATGSVE